MTPLRAASLTWWLLLSACGARECKLSDPASCPADQTCEVVSGRQTPLCFPPVTLEGRVFDVATKVGIADARVLALDENGAPAGAAAISSQDGAFRLRVTSARTDDTSAFTPRKVVLRAQAKNYLPFPSGARLSLPIDTGAASRSNDAAAFVLKTPQTEVGLDPVSAAAKDLPSVSGGVELSVDQKSVLLVLEGPAGPARTALAAADGAFTFFNVPAGTWRLAGYSRGVNYRAVDVVVQGADVSGVSLEKSTGGTASLSGSVQLVAGANNAGTSVVLVVESTFIEALGRGEVPPGLRAPEAGPPTVTGAFTISGIPDGRYVVLAAFENDDNVRDPDPGISGTQVQRITVSNGAVTGASAPSFKVTAAVGLVSPGRDAVDTTSATPTFTWQAFSNADAWVVRVFDTQGAELWQRPIAEKATTSLVYAGPALTAGRYYQWRITAMRRMAPTSQSEELRGLFVVQN